MCGGGVGARVLEASLTAAFQGAFIFLEMQSIYSACNLARGGLAAEGCLVIAAWGSQVWLIAVAALVCPALPEADPLLCVCCVCTRHSAAVYVRTASMSTRGHKHTS